MPSLQPSEGHSARLWRRRGADLGHSRQRALLAHRLCCRVSPRVTSRDHGLGRRRPRSPATTTDAQGKFQCRGEAGLRRRNRADPEEGHEAAGPRAHHHLQVRPLPDATPSTQTTGRCLGPSNAQSSSGFAKRPPGAGGWVQGALNQASPQPQPRAMGAMERDLTRGPAGSGRICSPEGVK